MSDLNRTVKYNFEHNGWSFDLFADDQYLLGLFFNDHYPTPPRRLLGAQALISPMENHAIESASEQLIQYFNRTRMTFDLPILARGTEFQEKVWLQLSLVPYGKRTTYKDICLNLGLPAKWSRAVAQAIASNPISVVIPCHRVIASSGLMSGYAGGIETKRKLLVLEDPSFSGQETKGHVKYYSRNSQTSALTQSIDP